MNHLSFHLKSNGRRSVLMALCSFFFLFSSLAKEFIHEGPATDLSNGKLQVSSNGRFLQFENGEPLFYPGETAWELFHRLSYTEAERFLENRRQKGFAVIRLAASKGLFMGLLPAWGDKVDQQWGAGPVIFHQENACSYGQPLIRNN
jgi:hypothetical protein